MQVACDDIEQLKIVSEIINRKNTLREIFNKMKNSYTENALSIKVLDDYNQYYQNSIDEKQQLFNAFNNISEYLEKLRLETSNTKESMNELRNDLDEILNKLDSIKNEII